MEHNPSMKRLGHFNQDNQFHLFYTRHSTSPDESQTQPMIYTFQIFGHFITLPFQPMCLNYCHLSWSLSPLNISLSKYTLWTSRDPKWLWKFLYTVHIYIVLFHHIVCLHIRPWSWRLGLYLSHHGNQHLAWCVTNK